MNIQPFKALIPHLDLIPSPDSFFANIKNDFAENNRAGFFKSLDRDSVFVQRIDSPYGSHLGLIAHNDLEDLDDGKILKHEHTLNSKEQIMLNFLLQAKAMVKPVLLAYNEVPEIEQLLSSLISSAEPDFQIDFSDKVKQKFWRITDPSMIANIQKLFKKYVNKCYIADGHHRCSTMLKLRSNKHLKDDGIMIDSILSSYFSFDNLRVLDYNRIIDIQGKMTPFQFISQLSRYFKIKKGPKNSKPKDKFLITMVIQNEWFELKWRKKVLRKHSNDLLLLDYGLFNSYVMEKILKIEDIRIDPSVVYSPGEDSINSVLKKVKTNKTTVGFFLPPLEIKDVKTAAENNITLPPKSTWFIPRIKSGVVVSRF